MKYNILKIVVCSLVISLWSCKDNTKDLTTSEKYYTEQHRPQFHFSPEENWMNDPNGMVYYEGEYHLFYQYYPDSTVWGPMHWGHAISEDLVHWEHLPIALFPDEHGLIFSGSAVVDWDNTTGFGVEGNPPLVAIFSYHDMEGERSGRDDYQTQGIAYSNDKGRSWTKYEGNPVIGNPGVRDFRDPKVIWHKDSKQWIMAVAALDHLKFYGSPNLKDWTYLSEFGKELGSHDGVWECPDLFPMKSDNGKEYWVLIENMNPGNPNGGSGTQYFIGQFDGVQFTVDEQFMKLLAHEDAIVPEGVVFESFENGYENWTIEGDAFGESTANGSLGSQMEVSGFTGKRLANSFVGGDQATGKIKSKPFTVSNKAINFLIGGGNHRGRTYISLLIDGNVVRQTEGKNSEQLLWTGWDVTAYIGQEAQIEIVDQYEGSWGHILIDEITFADQVASAARSGSVWLDAGRDNYAGVTWSDVPESDGRRIFLGWLSNWSYAQVVPTEKWRSAMTIPWSLSINHVDGIPRLVGEPIKELERLAADEWKIVEDIAKVPESGIYEIKGTSAQLDGFSISLSNSVDEQVVFSYKDGNFSFDRSKSGDTSFSPDFAGIPTTERISKNDVVSMHAYIDHSSIEIFLDNGQNVFTELFFPSSLYTEIEIKGLSELKIRELNNIWRQ
ncbi:glycoside hydrolase family 32 protein [Portibacter lacus]|nr:glycoside hydrolase family 32 protein [Portibacter lacus]